MSGVRYDFLELQYGRHAGRVEFEEAGAPFLIVGSNGTGKSTIIEALVRSLYGFRRLRRDERRAHRRRRPWNAGGYLATVGLSGPEGRLTFERDFESDQVVVRRTGEESPLFEGEANLSRAGETSRRYRDVLRRQFGLGDLDAYERTGCVQQGGLIRTELSEDLLRVAAGGHADVESAQSRLRQEYYELTLEPLADGETRRRKPGQLERLQEELAELESRARDARAAEARRAPLARERDGLRGEIASLQLEIEGLEAAFEGVSELETLRTAEEASRARVRQLEAVGHELDEAMARLDFVRTRDRAHEDLLYPEDFIGRIGALEKGLWPRRAKLDVILAELNGRVAGLPAPRRSPTLRLLAPGVLAAIGVWLLTQSMTLPGVLSLLVGVGSGGALWVRGQRLASERARLRDELHRAEEETRDLDSQIRALLSDVPDGGSLSPETLPHRRREFERQLAERKQLADAESSLRSAMDRARRVLDSGSSPDSGPEADRDADAMGYGPVTGGPSSGGGDGLVERGRDLLREIQRAVSNERDERLAPLKLRLLEASRGSFQLPDGVDSSGIAVRAALQERRARYGELQEELAGVERRIAYEGRPGQSALALEREIGHGREQVAALERRAAAYRQASALLTHAYEAFRSTDQQRLLTAISRHLGEISNGELGPLETAEGLETARVRAGDRTLPLASPPLSYGQLHMTLLAVRLGAADFLAGLGVRLPLLLDDPFVHLDAERARELWGVLASIASERQVIVATQDRLLIDHLGVEPDLDLDVSHGPGGSIAVEGGFHGAASGNGSPARAEGNGAPPTEKGRAVARNQEARAAPYEPENESTPTLDLWSALRTRDEEEES